MKNEMGGDKRRKEKANDVIEERRKRNGEGMKGRGSEGLRGGGGEMYITEMADVSLEEGRREGKGRGEEGEE